MNGITIVEEHLCRAVELSSLLGAGIFVTILVAGILAFYYMIYKYSDKSKSTKKSAISCSCFIVILLIITWAVQIYNYNRTHMEYTVTVADSVSLNDFHEKYEIISIDGNKYRVKEK